MSKKIKITDLSKILGLSPTLISMVLNGKGKENKISEATQQKVLETARKLNYTPNQSARALRMGKTFVIGLIVPDISNVFFSRIARHMEDELWKHGYRLVIGSTDENPDNEQRLINLFTTQNVDGIIAASTFQEKWP
jgi:LacI family transcriptional regulator